MLEEIFASYSLSIDQKRHYVAELSIVAIATIINAAAPKLTAGHDAAIAELLKAKNIDGALLYIQKLYSPNGWQKLLDQNIAPLVKSYTEEVLQQ